MSEHAPIRFASPATIQAGGKDSRPRRFDSTAYTGGELRVGGYSMPVVIDLAGLKPRNSVVANLDHDSSKRVGHIDEIENDGKTLRLSGLVSATGPAAMEFVGNADGGYPWQASVEAQPQKLETVSAGKDVQVNGRTFQGPIYIARKSVLSAVAFLPSGADDSTFVALAASLKEGNKTMAEFQEWLNEVMADTSELDAAQLANLHATYNGRREVTEADLEAVGPLITASSDPIDVEQRRISQIERACDREWGEHADVDKIAELKAAAIAGTISFSKLQNELFAQMVPPAQTVNRSRRDNNGSPAVIEAAICLSGGINRPEQHFSEQVLDAADKMRGVGLQGILIQGAAANGYSARPGERVTDGNLREILAYAMPGPREIRAGFSSINIPGILSNTANKFLMEGWTAVDLTSLRISGRASAKDFKTMTSHSLTGDFEFRKLQPTGSIEHGTLGEETYTNKVDTYARMLGITRTDIINDDLGALTAAPRRLGRGAALKLNDLFWTAFLNNATFYTSGRKNVSTGGGSALSSAGLAAAEVLFMNQTDPDGKPLGLMPSILLVPPTLKRTALELMNSSLVIGSTTADTPLPSGNTFQGAYSVESSPYMENATYTGYSAAAWYLLAAPSQMPVIEIAGLNGRVEPVVETAEADFSTLGVQLRGYSDVGVGVKEYRGGVRSAGS